MRNAAPPWIDAVDQIFSVIPDLAVPEQVQDGLREILDDPSLEIFWWDWEAECYVDIRGEPSPVAPRTPEHTATYIGYESRKVGAVLHDARLLDEPEFRGSFVPHMRIAMERDRLHLDLTRKLEELKASRLRMVTAGDQERRRLERNLHDGAQQRLTVALLGLRRLERMVGLGGARTARPAAARRSSRARSRTCASSRAACTRRCSPDAGSPRRCVRRARARRSRSSSTSACRELPPAVEAAAYYVCAEAVTNTVKHAQASKVWITLVHEDGALRWTSVTTASAEPASTATRTRRARRARRPRGGPRGHDRGREPEGEGTRLVLRGSSVRVASGGSRERAGRSTARLPDLARVLLCSARLRHDPRSSAQRIGEQVDGSIVTGTSAGRSGPAAARPRGGFPWRRTWRVLLLALAVAACWPSDC